MADIIVSADIDTLLQSASFSAARTNLGLGAFDTPSFAGITIGGNIAVTGTVDGRDIAADGLRLDALDQALVLKGTWSPSGGVFPGSGSAQAGETWIADDSGTIDGVAFANGDKVIATTDNASTSTYASNWVKSDNTDQVSSVHGRSGAVVAHRS